MASLLVYGELGSLLIGLLNDRIFHLPVHALILVRSLHFDHGAPIGRALLHLGIVHAAILEHRLVIVHVGDEHDDDRGAGVGGGLPVGATGTVVECSHVQLVLVPVQRDRLPVKANHTGDLLDHELARRRVAAHESEANVVPVLVGGDHRRDERVRPRVLVHVRRVHLLRELWLLVVLVLRVYAHRSRPRFRRLPCKINLADRTKPPNRTINI